MALADLRIPRETIKAPGGEFTVRGLGLVEIETLVRSHRDILSALYDQYVTDEQAPTDSFPEIASTVLQRAPEVAYQIIALGAGEPDQIDKVRELPFGVQFEALEAIGRLTFEMEGGPKKVVETVIRIAQSLTQTIATLQDYGAGSGESDGK